MKTIEKCFWKKASEIQRKTEKKYTNNKLGTQGYEIQGCYKCNGKNLNCDKYRK